MTLRILLVDDSTPFLEAASAILRRGGLEVVGVASTTAEALARVAQHRPDAVLVDVHLGSESGFDLARELDRRSGGKGCRVVLMSTHAGEDFAELIADSPAAGFVAKSDLSADVVRGVVEGARGRYA